MRFVDVKNDVAFRKIFGNEQKTVILISFLNAILELNGLDRITEVTLVDPFQLPRIIGEKASIIDVRAKDGHDRSFIIEMQVAEKDGFGKRIQYYTCKEYASQIHVGDEYTKLKPVYFIGILNFKFFPSKHYFSKHLLVDEETGTCTLKDLNFRFIELTKFRKKADELTNIIDKWTFFIKKAHKLKLIPESTEDEGLLAAYEEAQKHNWTKKEYDAYIYAGIRAQDARGELSFAKRKGREEGRKEGRKEGHREGLKEGHEKGLQEGRKKEREIAILGLYENKVPVPVIANALKTTEAIVKQVIEQFNNKKEEE